MKIHIEYTGLLNLREIGRRAVIEMPGGSTVYDLYLRLGLKEENRFMQAFINRDAAWDSTELKDNDHVSIVSIVAGG